MATDLAYTPLRDFLEANWSATPMRWPNETFTIPDTPTLSPWVNVEFEGGFYEQASLGNGGTAADRWREDGTLLLHIMAPSGSGALASAAYARQLAELFRGVTLAGDLRCQGGSIGAGGADDDDGNWWRTTVTIEWIRG
jgi:hypothetical protein